MINYFSANLAFVKSISSQIYKSLVNVQNDVQVEINESHDIQVYFQGKLVSDSITTFCDNALLGQVSTPSRVLMQEMVFDENDAISPRQLFSQILGADEIIGLQYLKSLQTDQSVSNKTNQRTFNGSLIPPDLVLLGAFSLLYLPKLIESFSVKSFVLIESDPKQLAAVFNLIDFKNLVDELKGKKIKFNLIFDEKLNQSEARISQITNHFAINNPSSMHGLGLFRSPVLSPALKEIFSWFNDTAGFLESVKGILGNETDELNQVTHALYSAIYNDERLESIGSAQTPHNFSAVIVASGPSLDQNIEHLKKVQDKLLIFASGSAFGALLRYGIVPKAVVLLEMSSIVYRDLLDLVSDGFSFDGITAFVSSTVDPRIPSLFAKTIVFHRPLSSAFCLFPLEQSCALPQAGPQAVNASLEVCIHLGYRKVLLVGCDFGASDPSLPRASEAMGLSPRIFDYPVAGSQGKTIFSNAQLCSTRFLFENIIEFFQVKATSVGEGALIRGVKHLPIAPNYKFNEFFQSSHSAQFFEGLGVSNVCNKKSFQEIIRQASQENDDIKDTLLNHFRDNLDSLWSSNLARLFNGYLSSDESNLTHGQKLHRRMSRSLYFFALQPMREVDSSRFILIQNRVRESILFIHEFYRGYYALLCRLVDKPVLPIWDGLWVRSLFNR